MDDMIEMNKDNDMVLTVNKVNDRYNIDCTKYYEPTKHAERDKYGNYDWSNLEKTEAITDDILREIDALDDDSDEDLQIAMATEYDRIRIYIDTNKPKWYMSVIMKYFF